VAHAPPPSTNAPSAVARHISAAEIQESGARNAWEVLRRLGRFQLRESASGEPLRIRPTRGRSTLLLHDDPVVLLDGVRLVDIGVLRNIRASTIASVDFYNSSQATVLVGTGATGGAIAILTRMR
jgi:outer membrane cobalamin receptor